MTGVTTAIGQYRPTAGTCPPEVWAQVSAAARQAVGAPEVAKTARQVRPYLGALAGLLAWLHAGGYDATDLSLALSGDTIESYVATLAADQATHRSRLRRLSTANGYDPAPRTPTHFPRRQYQPPYTDAEVAALWEYGRALTNRRRGLAICAVVALGAGCGLPVADLRSVDSGCVHCHDDDERLWVRAGQRCVPVREEYMDWVAWVIAERPAGPLVGSATGPNSIAKVATWVRNKPGVPDLSVFRLRSSWLCHHLTAGTPVLHMMAWAGLAKFDALDGYRPWLPEVPAACTTAQRERT